MRKGHGRIGDRSGVHGLQQHCRSQVEKGWRQSGKKIDKDDGRRADSKTEGRPSQEGSNPPVPCIAFHGADLSSDNFPKRKKGVGHLRFRVNVGDRGRDTFY